MQQSKQGSQRRTTAALTALAGEMAAEVPCKQSLATSQQTPDKSISRELRQNARDSPIAWAVDRAMATAWPLHSATAVDTAFAVGSEEVGDTAGRGTAGVRRADWSHNV